MFIFASCGDNNGLGLAVRVANAECPRTIEDGIVIESIELEGENVVYKCVMDETMYSVDMIQANYSEAKSGILNYLQDASDPGIRDFKKLCKDSNVGIIYRYVGDKSKKHCDVSVSPDEL